MARRRIGSLLNTSSCFQLCKPVEDRNVLVIGYKYVYDAGLEINVFSMAETTSSFNVIFLTYKLASIIFTLYDFAASSEIIAKSSIDLR